MVPYLPSSTLRHISFQRLDRGGRGVVPLADVKGTLAFTVQ